MAQTFTTSPAHTALPGTVISRDGVIFSAVFHDSTSCGLILYNLKDQTEVVVPFTDDCRIGSLYSVKLEGLDTSEWAYRYYRDNYSFEDPYARELIRLHTKQGERIACCLFPTAEDTLQTKSAPLPKAWADEILYCTHVKGLTASKTSKAPARGSFKAFASKIPYLKELGITAVELLPIYELRPDKLDKIVSKDIDPDAEERKPQSLPLSAVSGAPEKDNYWNFGEGCYFAPKKAYSATGDPQKEFFDLVEALHAAGIRIYLQLYFPDTVTIQTQLETVRFYVTHYGVDGFHLKGSGTGLATICSDPMLSDTAFFYYSFPYEELQKENVENPTVGRPSIRNLCEYTDSFQTLTRKLVKSDNDVLREFVKAFVSVPKGNGSVHYVANYEGFTLQDLVSYNWKHNEANGEENRDGCDENYSWNCGVEGKSGKREIKSLRNRQIRNFLLLNFLAQGTPLLYAGDERCNSQEGNNNPYCQDNETGWMNWKETAASKEILDFTKKIIAFRKENAIFRRKTPFRFNDHLVTGFPDVSFHGKEAWKPDFNGYSHSIGVLYDEHYAEEDPQERLTYLAINMHWHSQILGVPAPPAGMQWEVICDTFDDHSFLEKPERIPDQRSVSVRGRSVMILRTAPAPAPAPKAAKSTAAAPEKAAAAGDKKEASGTK